MVCMNEENDVQQKMFCYCDPYHLWNSTARECLEIANITQTAGNFREVHNVTGVLEKSAQKVFLGVVIAGLISVCLLLSFVAICSVYGCCDRHKKGRYGQDDFRNNQINEVAVIGLPQGTYEPIETDFSAIAV
ncbi:hypothetical protein RUM44_010811 [Polyplax serrata]|uniref:Uncharacterized protein n=2 Tax=Polyplax serrata TaxID=468196 RepID=A0ABR1AN85_POLSC